MLTVKVSGTGAPGLANRQRDTPALLAEIRRILEDGAKAPKDKSKFDVFLLHDRVQLDALWAGGFEEHAVKDYFGTKISWYFAWLVFYERALAPVSLLGVALYFADRFGYVSPVYYTYVLMPLWCVALTAWSTAYLECWKRKSCRLALAWHVLDLQAELEAGDETPRQNRHRWGRILLCWCARHSPSPRQPSDSLSPLSAASSAASSAAQCSP
jgi:hypothetical protein